MQEKNLTKSIGYYDNKTKQPLNKIGIKGNCLNLVRNLQKQNKTKKQQQKNIANFMFNSEKLNAFPLRSGTENDVPLVPFQYHTGSPS